MPLFDFLRKQINKKLETERRIQGEPIQPVFPPSKPTQPTASMKKSEPSTFGLKRDLLPPTYYEPQSQLVLAWITSAADVSDKDEWTILRRHRRYLEAHNELLDSKSDDVF